MRYLYEKKETQLVDLSLSFPREVSYLSPLFQLLHYLGVPYPICWIRLRKHSIFLDRYFTDGHVTCNNKRPGDFDLLCGPLENGLPTEYIVGIEVKRFKYILRGKRWSLIKPYSLGELQTEGYTFYGFQKVMLYHYVVAEPVLYDGSVNGRVWLDNVEHVWNGIDAVEKLGVVPTGPYGYSIGGWSQVPHKDPLHAGAPHFKPVFEVPENPYSVDKRYADIRLTLLQQIEREVLQKRSFDQSLPVIITYKNLKQSDLVTRKAHTFRQ
jgi:hypothetical protein